MKVRMIKEALRAVVFIARSLPLTAKERYLGTPRNDRP